MGSVVGEKFVRAVDRSIQNRSPLICFSSSGGALFLSNSSVNVPEVVTISTCG